MQKNGEFAQAMLITRILITVMLHRFLNKNIYGQGVLLLL